MKEQQINLGHAPVRPNRAPGRNGPARAPATPGTHPYSIVTPLDSLLRVAESPVRYDDDLSSRARRLDLELRDLARGDQAGRLVLGRLAARFLDLRGYEQLGFARPGDFAAERLGWSARQLQEVARVAKALARLPATELAFRRGDLGWSKARLLCSVTSPADEARWLSIAADVDVRTLASLTASARAAADEERRMASQLVAGSASTTRGEEEDEAEERVFVRIACTRRALQLWNDARRLAPQLAGRSLAQWEVAAQVAAEASSAPGPFAEIWQQEPWRSIATRECAKDGGTRESRPTASSAGTRAGDDVASRSNPHVSSPANAEQGREICSASFDEPARGREAARHVGESRPSPEQEIERELDLLDQLDAFELDAAMRRVRKAMQQREARLGLALGRFLDLHLYREIGFESATDYVRDNLGLCERTARDLVRTATTARSRSPLLATAYADGAISLLRVRTLLPVLRSWNAESWITRASEVTARRLSEEVAWAAARAELDPKYRSAMPPAPGQDVGTEADDRQMCARTASETVDQDACASRVRLAPLPHEDLFGIIGRFRVVFVAPLSVSAHFRATMQAFAHPTEPRPLALERMLEHVLAQWRSERRHRDPVFERDGYRCTAPGCSSYTNLHDHHIVRRSAGGSNDLSNRTTVCAWHHLRGIHGGLARATGQAPGDIEWELGASSGRRGPVMRCRGDRYV